MLFRNVLAVDGAFPLTEECGLADGGGGVRSASGRGRVGDGNSNDGRLTMATSVSPAVGDDEEEEEEVEEVEEEVVVVVEEEEEEVATTRTGDCSLNGDEGFDSLGGRGGGFDTVGLGFGANAADPTVVGDGSCDGFR